MKKFLTILSCFCSALLLCLAMLLFSVLGFGTSASRFAAEEARVGVLPVEAATAFAQNTMRYLRGNQSEWNGSEVLAPYGIAPSEAFVRHMAEVRHMVRLGMLLLVLFLILGLALLLPRMILRKPLCFGAWLAGLSLPLLLCAAVGIWCLADFDGFWYFLHRHFIPGGIFSASEPVMKLFPASLFASYVPPVVIGFLSAVGILILCGWIAGVYLPARQKKLEMNAFSGKKG